MKFWKTHLRGRRRGDRARGQAAELGLESGAPKFSELSRWAESLFHGIAVDPLPRGAVFTIEQLELHARALAVTHKLGERYRGHRLFVRLRESEGVINRCHELMSRAHAAGRRLTSAAEWLLDNHYLIEEHVFLARKHLPKGYARLLPTLEGGDLAGLPRVYDLILEFIAHVDGRVDDEALSRYMAAYQSVTRLTLGELWSVAIMLRLALIENLRRVAESMSWQRVHRDRALVWAQRLDTSVDEKESAVLVLADMVRENPPLSNVFVAQFTQALQGRGATTTFVLSWLEQRIADQGLTIEEVVNAVSQSQAAEQASMANSIASLRLVNATEWHKFVEANSATEGILREEPTGVYRAMDFATRDTYRHEVESLARRLRVTEEEVARVAVDMAARQYLVDASRIAAHVGYLLVDEGRAHLERALRGKRAARLFSRPMLRWARLVVYLTPVALLTMVGTIWLVSQALAAPWMLQLILATAAVFAASQFALASMNWLVSILKKPGIMPRMDFEAGIPDDCRTIVVVPTMLAGYRNVTAIIENLELRYLANRDPNLWFALLTDFPDASQEHVEGDETLLAAAEMGIEDLNKKYQNGHLGHFMLFHRPRLYNPREGCWMGRERKRGKIEDFNALLCGEDRACFSRIVGDLSQITNIRYIITLDTDTDLPWGAGWRLVGAAAHPLNRPVLDLAGQRLVRGYAILQPRVGISLRSAEQSIYARLLAGDVGIDPYTRVVSDLYQDLFAEASFIGKGIYDVGAFRQLLDGRFPDNAVLSHDLLESCYARSGQCSDVELLESSPSGYLADVSRRHRWMRGDWQIAPWLGPWVHNAQGKGVFPAITALGWWKIFDNLRRAFVTPAYTALLVFGWFVVPSPIWWTIWVLAFLVVPELLPGLTDLWQRPVGLPIRVLLSTIFYSTLRRLYRLAIWVAFVPFEASVALDATFRSLWRMAFGKRMLEWQTAAAVERSARTSLGQVVQRMWLGPVLALAISSLLIALKAWPSLLSASLILLAWFLSPLLAWWISQPPSPESADLEERDVLFLRRIARLTWRYFEEFVDSRDNWLPPDNIQETDDPRIAHRTSPTDIGLALLSNLSAYDLGYLSTGQLLERSARTLESMEKLERHRGHFLNWYDTQTHKALLPHYVSTVDSGNLVGHMRVLCAGLQELSSRPVVPARAWDGLQDTLHALNEQMVSLEKTMNAQMAMVSEGLASSPSQKDSLDHVHGILGSMRELEAEGVSLTSLAALLVALVEATTRLKGSFDLERNPQAREAAWWADALDRQAGALLSDLREMAPWLGAPVGSFDGEMKRALGNVDRAQSLLELGSLSSQAAELLDTMANEAGGALAKGLRLGAASISSRICQIDLLVQRCVELSQVDFTFLYDRKRKLLVIGYWVESRRLDNSFYDLLASEARLASYVAIASGQIPFEHWFALGRRLTTALGRQALLSWSGSMFEYLMPLLVMPSFNGTLLDQTCRAVVARQIEYGRKRGVPWGISESCYSVTDIEGTYQYHAFGVPGLGLQRGLGDDLVISPYASTLALLVDPRRALTNLRRMEEASFLGRYGFYEAIDYTTLRVPKGQRASVVRAFMAHHHGMSLLAIRQVLLGSQMQERFLQNPDLRAATLLLQERIPKVNALQHPHAWEANVPHRLPGLETEPNMRVFSDPNTPIPKVHLLSNGRYHVMVSAAGGGFSRWNDMAVTRWREDPTSESSGVFCYISEPLTRRCWSGAYQPTLLRGQRYEAVFTLGRAEFRRLDDELETHTEIAVSTEDDLEIRRVRITNRSEGLRSLMVTSYAEVVLAAGVPDELHRVFSNLFIQCEGLPGQNAILMTRRPRSSGERPPWLFCLLMEGCGKSGPCSFETDRARFIGRGGSVRRPAALEVGGPLAGISEPALDPCVALRRRVSVEADESVCLDLILGVATTRNEAMELIQKYQDPRMADRVFESAIPHSRAILGHIGASEADVQIYGQLAAAMVFPAGVYRAPQSILRRNRKGQSGLWGYAISGDLPIVLLSVSDPEHLGLVRELLTAHAYWRMRGLQTDLVIWNEDVSGYRHGLNDQILGLVAAGTEAQLLDRPGGVFVRTIESFPEEDRVLLQSVARIVIRDVDGPLSQQFERWRSKLPPRSPAMEFPWKRGREDSVQAPRLLTPPSTRDDLIFANGIGGFTHDGREYIIDLLPGRHTPAPWVNVIANERLGTVVSETGSAYTWFGNAQLFRLSPWSNDPVEDPSGEVLFVRDDESGRFFSPTPWPPADNSAYVCRHGFGYSLFEHAEDELETELTTYVAVSAPVKFWVLRIKNRGMQSRRLSVLASVDLVLGDLRSRHAMHVVTELEPLTGAILARNAFNSEFPNTVVFFDCNEITHSVSGDRAEFLGRNCDPSSPAAMGSKRLSGRLGAGLDPCAAIQAQIELPAGGERKVVFILGASGSTAEAIALIQRHRDVGAAYIALMEVWQFWNNTLGVLRVETPDAAMNVMMNGWLPYQVLSCRMLARSGFYQSGGAYGFRDQLQDCVSLLHQVPALSRQHLLRCAGRQFVEGDVQHWWHPPLGRGVRTRCSDDLLWLPYAVSRYVDFTGDTGVLDERVPYLTGRMLNEGEESYYDLPGHAEEIGTLYEHCVRAIQRGITMGGHGLPLMGCGDWNDGMNRLGLVGRGESVWLAFFLHHVLTLFASIAKGRAENAFAELCAQKAGELSTQIEMHAWDGAWYRRAWADDGQLLGSAQSPECRIDSLPQSWATISGVGSAEHQRLALDSMWEQLVRGDLQIVKLFTPPFESGPLDPGYIKGYPPGVRENGGQYTHGAVWSAIALALAGRSEQATALVSYLNPIHHTLDPLSVERYKLEPYVLAADIYSQAPHAGRGGWSWYTGSAAWYYRLLHETLLGIERRVDVIDFHPRVPASWEVYRVDYRYHQTAYHIRFTQSKLHLGPPRLKLDGEIVPEGRLRLVNDRHDHAVEFLFAPDFPA